MTSYPIRLLATCVSLAMLASLRFARSVTPGASLGPAFVDNSKDLRHTAVATVTASATTTSSESPAVRPAVSPRELGAAGDGKTDDTRALARAITTGKDVRCTGGDSYLIDGGLLATTPDQVMDFSGCTVTLKAGAAHPGMLRLNGARSRVLGGRWDQNGSANSRGDPYGHFAVALGADFTTAEHIIAVNSHGLGIKVIAGVSGAAIRYNQVTHASLMGIYLDAAQADVYDNEVSHNRVDVSSLPSASGIYVASAAPFTYLQRRFRIYDNVVIGSASATDRAVGITARGMDCVVRGNSVQGTSIGISVDMSIDTRCLVTDNEVKAANGPAAYGIEYNGGKGLVMRNRVQGGKYGIIGTGQQVPGASLSDVVVMYNELLLPTVSGIHFRPAPGAPAHRLVIAKNTIRAEIPIAGAIRLASDCRGAQILSNTIEGPGSSKSGGRAIFLDRVNSDVTIFANTFSGWERAVALYNPTAVEQTAILFENNDVRSDVPDRAQALLNLEGAATWGSGVRLIANLTHDNEVPPFVYIDKSERIIFYTSTASFTPQGHLVAPAGSVYIQPGGTTPTLYTKTTSDKSTDWVKMQPSPSP
jgi:hypothetical protein